MSTPHRRHLILLDPGRFGDPTALSAIRAGFFDWLKVTDGEVVEDGGANRLVISSRSEVAEQIRDLDDVLKVEPYA
ncbi:hypothetical protein AB0C34_03890 [Nocardia sp. NPDC049220]|uniref:hypothetical protein n=1 Tax=Nocardia sp. NPDC049220 TaxID=3155273 RepID=UPI0033D49C38